MNELEKQIRGWWGNCGNEVDKDELISVLLQMAERIEALEDAIAKATGEQA